MCPHTDGNPSEAMDIDKDKSKHSRRKKSTTKSKEVINTDSDEEEDENPHTVQVDEDMTAMNSGYIHMEQSESEIHIPVQAQGDINADHQKAEVNGAMNAVPSLTPLNQGKFPLKGIFCWKLSGYFDKDLKVWRIGQTVECAILFKDA